MWTKALHALGIFKRDFLLRDPELFPILKVTKIDAEIDYIHCKYSQHLKGRKKLSSDLFCSGAFCEMLQTNIQILIKII